MSPIVGWRGDGIALTFEIGSLLQGWDDVLMNFSCGCRGVAYVDTKVHHKSDAGR